MPVQPSSAEEHPESFLAEEHPEPAVKAGKRRSCERALFDYYNFFTSVAVYPEVKFLLLFYNNRAIYWACAGKKYTGCKVHVIDN